MSDGKITTDDYEDFVEDTFSEVEKADREYRDAYYDGAYDFFAFLLGEPK